ncbi:MAG: outer membrane lipoprotein carrier protein LolA [Bacteroidota bacterium]
MKRLNLLVIMLMTVLSLQAFSFPPDRAVEILQDSRNRLENLADFSATFYYQVSNPATRAVMRDGSVQYKNKNKFILKLSNIELYSDGARLWEFENDPDYPLVTIKQLDQDPILQTVFQVYEAKAKPRYDGTEMVHGVNCDKIFLYVEDPSLDYQQAYVWINRDTRMPEKVTTVDAKKTRTTIEFQDLTLDSGMEDRIFRFQTSDYPGIEVIDETR